MKTTETDARLECGTVENGARTLRVALKEIGERIALLKGYANEPSALIPPDADRGELMANITLAFRHTEDAAMRLGKAIQAYDGGRSCYDDRAKLAASRGAGTATAGNAGPEPQQAPAPAAA